MGYFNFGLLNFAYRIWKSKKFRKFVIGFGFLAFVLSTIISNTTFAAQSDSQYTTDTNIALLQYYDTLDSVFEQSFNQLYEKNSTYTANFKTLFSYINLGFVPYYSYNSNESVFNIYLYEPKNFNSLASSSVTTDFVINDNYRVPCTRL